MYWQPKLSKYCNYFVIRMVTTIWIEKNDTFSYTLIEKCSVLIKIMELKWYEKQLN